MEEISLIRDKTEIVLRVWKDWAHAERWILIEGSDKQGNFYLPTPPTPPYSLHSKHRIHVIRFLT